MAFPSDESEYPGTAFPLEPFDAAAVSAYMKNHCDLHLRLEFTLGDSKCTFWTSDLTYDYVRLNAEYTT